MRERRVARAEDMARRHVLGTSKNWKFLLRAGYASPKGAPGEGEAEGDSKFMCSLTLTRWERGFLEMPKSE